MATLKEKAQTAARLDMWEAGGRVVAEARTANDGSLDGREIEALDRVVTTALNFPTAIATANAIGLAIEAGESS